MKFKHSFATYLSALSAAILISGVSNVYAAPCTNDTSPGTSCDNLVLTTSPAGTISIGVTVTGTASGNPALTIQSGVTSGNISIGSAGT